MLMFRAEAGPLRNKSELKRFFDIIVERAQRRYDVSYSAPPALTDVLPGGNVFRANPSRD